MRSPSTIGLDAPAPGSGVFQAMFSVSLHVVGIPDAELIPIPVGPRKPDQSVARASAFTDDWTAGAPELAGAAAAETGGLEDDAVCDCLAQPAHSSSIRIRVGRQDCGNQFDI